MDLVDLCKDSLGEVLPTCRVPRERVLLSQFGDWHSALNRSPLIIELPGESDEEYCARLVRAFDEVDARIRATGVALDAGYRHGPEDLTPVSPSSRPPYAMPSRTVSFNARNTRSVSLLLP